MSGELAKRLRDSTSWYHVDCELKMKCAARIEELEANLAEQIEWVKRLADDLIAAEGREARLKEKLARAVEALRGWIDFANEQGMPVSLSDLEAAQLTGGKDA